jgi:hypothetical protein
MTCILAPPLPISVVLRIASCHPSSSSGPETTRTISPSQTCIVWRPTTTMADDPLPTVDFAATAADFPGIAQSTGIKLKERLSSANLTSNDSDLAWSEISQHQESLETVMEEFRKNVSVFKRCSEEAILTYIFCQEFRKLHPHGELHWSKLFLTIRAASFSENYWGKRSGDAWLLTLFASDSNEIGRSFSMHSEFTVSEGDIHLGYVVK